MRLIRGTVYEAWFREALPGTPKSRIYKKDIRDKPHLQFKDYPDLESKLKVC